eukprot:6127196-Amphidinium_carterae.4
MHAFHVHSASVDYFVFETGHLRTFGFLQKVFGGWYTQVTSVRCQQWSLPLRSALRAHARPCTCVSNACIHSVQSDVPHSLAYQERSAQRPRRHQHHKNQTLVLSNTSYAHVKQQAHRWLCATYWEQHSGKREYKN